MSKYLLLALILIPSNLTFADWDHQDELTPFVEYLSWCESRHKPHIKVLDTNGAYSYGRFQFQMHTFKWYVQRYNLAPDIEEAEYLNLIYDGDFQEKVVRRVLEEGRNDWYMCTKSYQQAL